MKYSFSNCSLGLKLFLKLRWFLTPYQKMVESIGNQGAFLDIGCGHGLLSALIAKEDLRVVYGIDHDKDRLEVAKTSTSQNHNIHFFHGDLDLFLDSHPNLLKFKGIFLIDVLHYLSESEQKNILHKIRSLLDHDGVFVMREVHPDAGIMSLINRFYEWMATKTKFTKSQNQKNSFKRPREWEALLFECGFLNVKISKCSFFLFSDYLFEAKVSEK